MAFCMKNICQNGIKNAQSVSKSKALRALPVRQMQPRRVASTVIAFMETKPSETATPASTLQMTVSVKLSVSYLL
jgi:hypothetical protein